MLSKKFLIGLAAVIVFTSGVGYIVYAGRPVMKIVPSTTSTIKPVTTPPSTIPTQTSASTPTPTPAAGVTTYTMTDVQMHATKSDCWSAIGGGVYDLTSWVSRHPGGEAAILGMCGVDGTDAYNGQHGGARRPLAYLALLKIGTLQ